MWLPNGVKPAKCFNYLQSMVYWVKLQCMKLNTTAYQLFMVQNEWNYDMSTLIVGMFVQLWSTCTVVQIRLCCHIVWCSLIHVVPKSEYVIFHHLVSIIHTQFYNKKMNRQIKMSRLRVSPTTNNSRHHISLLISRPQQCQCHTVMEQTIATGLHALPEMFYTSLIVLYV